MSTSTAAPATPCCAQHCKGAPDHHSKRDVAVCDSNIFLSLYSILCWKILVSTDDQCVYAMNIFLTRLQVPRNPLITCSCRAGWRLKGNANGTVNTSNPKLGPGVTLQLTCAEVAFSCTHLCLLHYLATMAVWTDSKSHIFRHYISSASQHRLPHLG